jgi:hypothetical protein
MKEKKTGDFFMLKVKNSSQGKNIRSGRAVIFGDKKKIKREVNETLGNRKSKISNGLCVRSWS